MLEGLRILVVDDDLDARELTTAMLKGAGAAVRNVSSAADALAALDVARSDLIVSDLSMPDMDGYQLMTLLRAREAAAGVQRVPAVAVSGHAFRADVDRAIAAGFDAHMAKPVDMHALIEVVRRLSDR